MGLADAGRQPSPLPAEILAAKTAVQNRSDTARAVANEISIMRLGLDPATPPPIGLDNLPLLVLTAENRIDPDIVTSEAKRLNRDVETELQLARIQQTEQEELTRLSTNSRQIIVRGSGHFIMHDRPEELIIAVREFTKPLAAKPGAGRQIHQSTGPAGKAPQVR